MNKKQFTDPQCDQTNRVSQLAGDYNSQTVNYFSNVGQIALKRGAGYRISRIV